MRSLSVVIVTHDNREAVRKALPALTAQLDVTADQYPYVASATSLGAVIPPKFHEGGAEAFVARLKDPAQRAAIRARPRT